MQHPKYNTSNRTPPLQTRSQTPLTAKEAWEIQQNCKRICDFQYNTSNKTSQPPLMHHIQENTKEMPPWIQYLGNTPNIMSLLSGITSKQIDSRTRLAYYVSKLWKGMLIHGRCLCYIVVESHDSLICMSEQWDASTMQTCVQILFIHMLSCMYLF